MIVAEHHRVLQGKETVAVASNRRLQSLACQKRRLAEPSGARFQHHGEGAFRVCRGSRHYARQIRSETVEACDGIHEWV